MDLTTDLEDIVKQGEGLSSKKVKVGGLKLSGASIMGLLALISTVVGSMYGGFLLYQKVESLANLDLGAISSQMKKTSADVLRVEEVASAIKIELKEDLSRLRDSSYNLENRIDTKLQSIDVRITNMDNKLDKFDLQLDATEEKLMKRIQQSLDNPLNN
jgi:hypothetical protein